MVDGVLSCGKFAMIGVRNLLGVLVFGRAISEAFGYFPSQSSSLLPILKSRLELEEDEDVIEYLQESISAYSGS